MEACPSCALCSVRQSPAAPGSSASGRTSGSVQERAAPEGDEVQADRRVMRTQRLLREALFSLVLERGWDQVSVRAICERADVGRSTFYVHFADKEDLLLSGFELFQHDLLRHAQGSEDDPLAFLKPLLVHVQEHHRIARALAGKRSGRAVEHRLLRVISGLLEHALAERLPAGATRDVTLRYLSGAIFEVVIWWLDSRSRAPAAELETLLRGLIRPVLHAPPMQAASARDPS